MDKIVDHLFILEDKVLWRISRKPDFRAYEDSADVVKKEENKAEKKD
jgi:ATP-binding cassette subfamily F protein uup